MVKGITNSSPLKRIHPRILLEVLIKEAMKVGWQKKKNIFSYVWDLGLDVKVHVCLYKTHYAPNLSCMYAPSLTI